MEAILPITDFEEHQLLAFGVNGSDNDELYTGTPYYPYGITFLRRVHIGKNTNSAPGLKSGGPFLPLSAIEELFGEAEDKIRYRYMVGVQTSLR
jgi:hypothetical protein